MKFNILTFLFVFILAFSFVSSVPPVTTITQFPQGYAIEVHPITQNFKAGQDVTLNAHVQNSSNGYPINASITCWLHLYNSSGNHIAILSTSTVINLYDYSFKILGGNFTKETKSYLVYCYGNGLGGYSSRAIEVTSEGQEPSLSYSNFYILAFFIVLFLLFIYIHNSVDLDSWYRRILTRYETKNYFKLVMSSIGYNIMANGFALFYILGMPIVMLVSNIISVNNITPLLWFSENLLWVYAWASILVFISIVGKAQEFIVELLKDIDNSLWGFGNDK